MRRARAVAAAYEGNVTECIWSRYPRSQEAILLPEVTPAPTNASSFCAATAEAGAAVKPTCNTQASQGQSMVLAFRKNFLDPFKLFPLRSEAELNYIRTSVHEKYSSSMTHLDHI